MALSKLSGDEKGIRVRMALSCLSSDEQGIILSQLCNNTLEPRLAMYFSSASKDLRALLTPAAQQQLRTDYEAATALCRKMGMRSCKRLRKAIWVSAYDKGLSEADLARLATLGSVLPALQRLALDDCSGSAALSGELSGARRLAEGLVAGALPALKWLEICDMHVGEAGAWALAAALDRGAMPRLKGLFLVNDNIGDAALAALAPALRRRPALQYLNLCYNPFGDEGLAALVAPPPPPAGSLLQPAGGLKKLLELDLEDTQVTDAGCAAFAAALHGGTLPALVRVDLDGIPASDAAKAAVYEARTNLEGAENDSSGSKPTDDEGEDEGEGEDSGSGESTGDEDEDESESDLEGDEDSHPFYPY